EWLPMFWSGQYKGRSRQASLGLELADNPMWTDKRFSPTETDWQVNHDCSCEKQCSPSDTKCTGHCTEYFHATYSIAKFRLNTSLFSARVRMDQAKIVGVGQFGDGSASLEIPGPPHPRPSEYELVVTNPGLVILCGSRALLTNTCDTTGMNSTPPETCDPVS